MDDKIQEQINIEVATLQQQGIVSGSSDIKNKLKALFESDAREQVKSTLSDDAFRLASPQSSSIDGDRLETICQTIYEKMVAMEGEMKCMKQSLAPPPLAPPPLAPPPLAPPPLAPPPLAPPPPAAHVVRRSRKFTFVHSSKRKPGVKPYMRERVETLRVNKR